MGVSWSDGRLAGCTLHAALRACGIDPTTVIFVNLFEDRDDRWELDLEALAQLLQVAAAGATIVARSVSESIAPSVEYSSTTSTSYIPRHVAGFAPVPATRPMLRLCSTGPPRLRPTSPASINARRSCMPGPSTLSTTPNALACLTENEIRRLVWLSGTVAAERHLVPIDQPCPDHEQCRRLAFALWLRVTDRLSDVTDPARQSTPPTP